MSVVEDNEHVMEENSRQPGFKGRSRAWVVLFFLSLIAMVSLLVDAPIELFSNAGFYWAFVVTVISSILSFGSVVGATAFHEMYRDSVLELGAASILASSWGAALPVILNPNNAIAVDKTVVIDANLYFSSWGSFIATVWMIATMFRDFDGGATNNNNEGWTKYTRVKAFWLGLVVASAVATASSVRLYFDTDCNKHNPGTGFCQRTLASSVMGGISFWLAILLTCSATFGNDFPAAELVGAACLVILWIVGASVLTFGRHAPGGFINNLFFATWACLALSMLLLSDYCQKFFREYRFKKEPEGNQSFEEEEEQSFPTNDDSRGVNDSTTSRNLALASTTAVASVAPGDDGLESSNSIQ